VSEAAAAIPADILRAVERYIDATGIRSRHGNSSPRGWRVSCSIHGVVLLLQPEKLSDPAPYWTVAPPIALAFCIVLASGAESVDVGRCPSCVGRGTWWTWHRSMPAMYQAEVERNAVSWQGHGWQTFVQFDPVGGSHFWRLLRARRGPCEACRGTGRERAPAEQLLLDAASGDATARANLDAHADARLRDRGDPLGELLSWALTLWTGELVDCGACPTCKGHRCVYREHAQAGPMSVGCTDCGGTDSRSGSGRQLGHPHTAEAVAQLAAAWERLTVPCGRCEGAGTVTLHAQGFGARVRAPARGVEELVRCEACSGHGRVKHVELRHQGERTIDDVAMAVAQIRGVQFAQVDDCTSDSRIAPGTIEIRYYGTAHESAVEIAIQARVPPTVRVLAINSPSLTLHALQQDR
jgi:hypothetical protein